MNDPISLTAFLNSAGVASGSLYLDDGQTYDYRNKSLYIQGAFNYEKKTLNYQFQKGNPQASGAWLERITIYGFPSKPNKIQWQLVDANQAGPASVARSGQLAFKFDSQLNKLTIRKPALPFGQSWQVKIL